MPTQEFEEIVKEIKEKDKEFKISPRKLIAAFEIERRTKNNQSIVNKYLDEHQLEVSPSYVNTWIDGEIIIRHKKKARSKNENDPIQRLKLLPAANNAPVSVNRDAKLSEAVTLMMMNNYSQLPVITGTRSVVRKLSITLGHLSTEFSVLFPRSLGPVSVY
jgi:CBS domain-containing protein